MGKGLEKENSIYEYVVEKIEQEGFPPSIREIAAVVNLASPSSVFAYLRSLEKKGKLIISKGKKRAISLPPQVRGNASFVPIIGKVTAGLPILAQEEVLGTLPFDGRKASGKKLFALEVKGDSMKNAAILNGDYVVVERTPVCNNGDIVVALIEDEATVKRFYKEDGHFRLQPENEEYQPIIVDSVSVLGKVIATVRYIR